MSEWFTRQLHDALATEMFGRAIGQKMRAGQILFLSGVLGAGKTTLVRGMLRALGHLGAVKSPTYTLVETYALPGQLIHHFDLYRLKSSTELYDMGFEDYLSDNAIIVIEWPEHAASHLPAPTLSCTISVLSSGEGRVVEVTTQTEAGRKMLEWLSGDER